MVCKWGFSPRKIIFCLFYSYARIMMQMEMQSNNSLLIVLQCSFASLQIVLSALFVMLVSVKENNSNDELLSCFRHITSIFCKTKQHKNRVCNFLKLAEVIHVFALKTRKDVVQLYCSWKLTISHLKDKH